ncbi:MAG: hypothetical protein HYR90_00090 [Candidatus Andersenbacteria bacterium]|nr:hypothetical protein [Candidatus Andersenbacteria bacterium]MBI3251128.1 hypothetical protein [Candidatus Andersenbacteria bacterium]
MSSRLLIAFLLILGGSGVLGWYYYQGNVGELLKDFEAGTSLLPLSREVITPPPLRGPFSQQQTTLTADGVFTFTNQHRTADGKQALTRNTTLDMAAENKLEDMFARQYFEHQSPTGEGPAEVVEGVGYLYIRVGENLALGNFESDQALVQAWMDSPGHRANMLSAGFTEIGIAVGQGMFEGDHTWLAVQTFATPASACPLPEPTLKTTIDKERARLDSLDKELKTSSAYLTVRSNEIKQLFEEAARKIEEGNAEIEKGNHVYEETGNTDQAQPHWDKGKQLQEEGKQLRLEADKQAATYEVEQKKYNDQVNQLNSGSTALAKTIEQYNKQVQASNACAEKFSE